MEKTLDHYKSNGSAWDFVGRDLSRVRPEPGRIFPEKEIKREDENLQNFLTQHNAYMEAKQENAARENGSQDEGEMDNEIQNIQLES
ncbi:hypothetical protein HO133_000598 [Letharia lupina]|uniref:Uncharacterized protein n=1 Tax=Letharia lupina TaxID=560253 RepID=A0A8H6CFD4_9LECA|nr:uncharacterized protein HO133_000598 [Letharia lupina]KAF6222553.1 hypothetical protein HO133_000598 [Letharia lupina]